MLRRSAVTLVALIAMGRAFGTSAMAIQTPLPSMIFFDPGSSAINSQGEDAISKAAGRFHSSSTRNRLTIEAHTNGAEARSSSDLSPRRAEAVKKRLLELGLPADRIEIRVYGDLRPLVIAPPGASEAQNRRVEIITD